ncbi:unnamed protein product [Prorocentrum cordatum]|uniref:Phospholipid scramblase n=1 Tax=Prorocentrum cordatum TaxID=2364126 RepID=A0ABN9RIG1_9DINO|nr:unnamed protein product [Polarella glacialis]
MGQHIPERFAFNDLVSAREEIQMGIFQDTFWLAYAWCCGLGCLSPSRDGWCLNIGQCCCCAGTCRDAACWDNDGIVASTVKICCCVWHSEAPPSMTPGFGCGYPWSGCFCCRNMPPPNILEMPRGLEDPNEREEFQILMGTCWCFFLYCCGLGCNPPGGNDTCCKLEGKLCCFWANLETDDSYEETDRAHSEVLLPRLGRVTARRQDAGLRLLQLPGRRERPAALLPRLLARSEATRVPQGTEFEISASL